MRGAELDSTLNPKTFSIMARLSQVVVLASVAFMTAWVVFLLIGIVWFEFAMR